MKATLLSAFILAATFSLQSCNTTETHEKGLDHPAGAEQGPQSAEEARDKAGDDPNDQGTEAANDHGDQPSR
jgi:hypothetical protein